MKLLISSFHIIFIMNFLTAERSGLTLYDFLILQASTVTKKASRTVNKAQVSFSSGIIHDT